MFSANQIATFLLGLSVVLIPWGLTEIKAIDLEAGVFIFVLGLVCLFGAVGLHFYPYCERCEFSLRKPYFKWRPLVYFGTPTIVVTSHRLICIPVTLSMSREAIPRAIARLYFRGPLLSDKSGLQIHPDQRPAKINLRWIDRNHESRSIDEVTLEYGRTRHVILLAIENDAPSCIANENFLLSKPNRRKWRITDIERSWFQVEVESGTDVGRSDWIPGYALVVH